MINKALDHQVWIIPDGYLPNTSCGNYPGHESVLAYPLMIDD